MTEAAPSPTTERRGPADARTVVFVHGAGVFRRMRLPQLEALAGAYRVVALDLPGHGAAADDRFRFDAALDRLDRLVTGADGPVVLVGRSLGGYLAPAFTPALRAFLTERVPREDGGGRSGAAVGRDVRVRP